MKKCTETGKAMNGKTAKEKAVRMLRAMIADENAWYKKVVPQKLRRMISNPLADRIAAGRNKRPLEKKPKRYRPGKYPPGINLYGLLKSEIGLAQGAKLYAKALEAGNIPHTLLNVDYFDDLPQEDATFDDRLTTENRYAINLAHINPPEWRAVMGRFPQEQFDGHYNIGIFQWELETVPDEWVPMFDYVDEVWTPSAFTARTMSKVTKKPVIPVLYGMEAPFDETLTRGDFGLSDEDFLVLMMFDSKSFASRKNPGGAIDAFREAFGEKAEHVKLVIKINNPKEEDIAFVEEHLGGAEYVMITERMDKPRLNSLIRLCDVFISLHRAEGFGLVMAEAMMLGTPAVATDWSANTEFMSAESACMVGCRLVPVDGAYHYTDGKMMWADPDVHQAAEYLKRLREDPEYHRQKAEAGKRYVEECLSMEKCAEAIRARMNEILGGKRQWTSGR